jgi:(R,R)-butanediol dehydrogenase/meso-butanediol dehydrogenase/diacetyl reductase
MRAAVVTEGGSFEVRTVADPEPGPGELLLRVTACGLCGSDDKARIFMPPETVMGHEFAGEVVGTGDPALADWLGRQVAVLPVLFCGECQWCQAGFVTHCPTARRVGLGDVGGGFAEYAVVTPASAFPLPSSVPPVHGALVEPFAVGLHCLNVAEMQPGDDVLVVGTGAVGATTIAWARAKGAGRITAVDPAAGRREVSLSLGATEALASIEEVEQASYDVIVECVGKPSLLDPCLAAARPRGRVICAGVAGDPTTFVSIVATLKELSIRFAVYYTPAEFREVIDGFASGLVDPSLLLSDSSPLDGINAAFDALTNVTTRGKALLDPR